MLQTSPSKPHPYGSIIATASVAGLRSNAGATDYSASKAAVISIMQTVAYQLAGTGIRCNAVCPGIIETGMTSLMYEMARQRGSERKIGQLNPLMRGGLADEVARVVAFLGSESASYVNGQAWVSSRYLGVFEGTKGKLANDLVYCVGRRWRLECWTTVRAWQDCLSYESLDKYERIARSSSAETISSCMRTT
jgi:hypothetical protein